MTHQLEFYAYQQIGTDVFADSDFTQRLAEKDQLVKGMEVWLHGPMSELRKITVKEVNGDTWSGDDGHMMVTGCYMNDRHPDAGWVASCFGDMRALARVEF